MVEGVTLMSSVRVALIASAKRGLISSEIWNLVSLSKMRIWPMSFLVT